MRRPVVKSTSVNSTSGDYFAAVEDKTTLENAFPHGCSAPGRFRTYSDESYRLRQSIFSETATVQDIPHRHYQLHKTYDESGG